MQRCQQLTSTVMSFSYSTDFFFTLSSHAHYRLSWAVQDCERVMVRNTPQKNWWKPSLTNAEDDDPPPRPLKVTFAEPATHWTDAIPIGNGRLGAMVWGAVPSEALQLNEDTLWTGIPGDYSNKSAPQALAEVRKLVDDGKFSEATAAAAKLSVDPSDDTQLVSRKLQTSKAVEVSLIKRGDDGPGGQQLEKLHCGHKFTIVSTHRMIKHLIVLMEPDRGFGFEGGLYNNLFTAHSPFQFCFCRNKLSYHENLGGSVVTPSPPPSAATRRSSRPVPPLFHACFQEFGAIGVHTIAFAADYNLHDVTRCCQCACLLRTVPWYLPSFLSRSLIVSLDEWKRWVMRKDIDHPMAREECCIVREETVGFA
ncbi:Alpha-L-fucosidase 2 isoform B [Glycine soja]|uniref:Alpha-L-fucosidase 2 isoform B n=1 Tax=Glycine soja TaxID=3848 RepID=A0A445IT19_GLYSO|nr:Alpha-L-fucosidase 2 isoform B [Glycine soja]